MGAREWLVRHAATLAVASALVTHSGIAEAQLLPLLFPLPATVSTDKGSLIGQSTTTGIRQFLGIPYAAPPTGSRRWQPPAPESFYLLRDATKFAKHCAQPASPFGQASTDEDCLYLNVFAPPSSLALTFQPAPVMVWLHPGEFENGESDDYDPTALVKKGLVVVTVNYRLGALGNMAHPALTAESSRHASGNYGLQDQQAALRWVQRNIRNFGGDPKKVTIVGEDAGGVSVYAHLVSPDSAGLFQRAIAQSGEYATYLPQRTLAAAEAAGQTFATAVGCPQQNLACLRAVPVSALLAKQGAHTLNVPHVDGAVLPQDIFSAISQGHINRVPVLHGTTREEFSWYLAWRELQGFPTATVADVFSNAAALLSLSSEGYQNFLSSNYGLFPSTPLFFALLYAGTDVAFACRMIELSHLLNQYVPVWSYEFTEQVAPHDMVPDTNIDLQTFHTSDVQYLLDGPDGRAAFSADQAKTADNMKNYWAAFASTGNPNTTGMPAWPQYLDTPGDTSQTPDAFMLLQTYPVPVTRWYIRGEHGCQKYGDNYTWTFDSWYNSL